MKIAVCVKQKADGLLNPFDACAYEAALRIKDAQVVLVSMAPEKSGEMLLNLTRLGAKEAFLLCDKAFSGADTLATAYTLSLAMKNIKPQLVICGRQTVDGDTGQVGPGLSQFLGASLITNVMEISDISESSITCVTRENSSATAEFPAVITVERINDLRSPSIRSKKGTLTVLDAKALEADVDRCGLKGSPTRVISTFENNSDKRRCTFITKEQLKDVISAGLANDKRNVSIQPSQQKLKNVWSIGTKPLQYAYTVSDDVKVVPLAEPETLFEKIKAEQPQVILWDSSYKAKQTAARVQVMLNTGLCADCTALETDGTSLFMYRPAFSGNVIAKIKCITMPQMATVRTVDDNDNNVMVALGKGALNDMKLISAFARNIGAEMVSTRGAVDEGGLDYSMQVGLTGRSVAPKVYIAAGVSGAVHHIAGMKNSGTVIAINCDKKAQIFDYADYGIVDTCENVFG